MINKHIKPWTGLTPYMDAWKPSINISRCPGVTFSYLVLFFILHYTQLCIPLPYTTPSHLHHTSLITSNPLHPPHSCHHILHLQIWKCPSVTFSYLIGIILSPYNHRYIPRSFTCYNPTLHPPITSSFYTPLTVNYNPPITGLKMSWCPFSIDLSSSLTHQLTPPYYTSLLHPHITSPLTSYHTYPLQTQ